MPQTVISVMLVFSINIKFEKKLIQRILLISVNGQPLTKQKGIKLSWFHMHEKYLGKQCVGLHNHIDTIDNPSCITLKTILKFDQRYESHM